jgi:hypothetical protein
MTSFETLSYVFGLLLLLHLVHIPFIIGVDKIITYYNNKNLLD